MEFRVLPMRAVTPSGINVAFLETNGWNDYGFQTLFSLKYRDRQGELRIIGPVKIAKLDMDDPAGRPVRSVAIDLPEEFELLQNDYFSLGQDESYYEHLNALGEGTRDIILSALKDIAANTRLFDVVSQEKVTQRSLLRSITTSTVRQQFHRIALGGARLSPYSFSYTYPRSNAPLDGHNPGLSFSVQPESQPPTNVHVIIGRNGVGKSRLLNKLADILVGHADSASSGTIEFAAIDREPGTFANLVSVAFSAFDDFDPIIQGNSTPGTLQYSYIGLKSTDRSEVDVVGSTKSNQALAAEFGESVRECLEGARFRRWRRALEMLQSDPIFADARVSDLATTSDADEEGIEQRAVALFGNLSSGHKIVLLIMTRLVETIEERTLLLIDEPESHLHPPLLSAFIRTLSDLLIDRNGVAIVATHSPVVLQEVPQHCVWKLRRSGNVVEADRPSLETFGENVGFLTHEVFGLEVTNSGFHRMLSDAVAEMGSYSDVVEKFEQHLGSEARALLRALIAERDSRGRR